MSTPTPPDSDAADSQRRPSQSSPPPHGQVRTLFPLGHLVATPGALRELARFAVDPMTLVRRHAQGDWGGLCAEDLQTNIAALTYGNRLMSSYTLTRSPGIAPDTRSAVVTAEDVTDNDIGSTCVIWIITEADRSVTTLLLPRDY